jgi:hypothetical protein
MLSEILLAALVLSFAAILVVSALYLVAKLFDWSKDKPLPGTHNRILNIAVVSLVTSIMMLLIVDVEMIVILPAVKSGLLTLVEEIDLLATGVIVMLIVFVLITLRRIRRETKSIEGRTR